MLKSQIDAIPVGDITTADFPSLSPEDTVTDSLALMKRTGYQEIPVIDKGAYVGMMRYSTILRKKSAIPDTKVKTLVSSLPTVDPDMEVTEIAELMVTNNCRQLAVLDGKKVIGIVSRTALIQIAAGLKSLKDVRVWEIMTTPVVYCRDNDMLASAVETMRDLDIRTLPVTDSADRLIGVVGMKEVIEHGWSTGDRSAGIGAMSKSPANQIPVSSVAVTNVLTVDWEDDMEVAADIMSTKKISTLPVTDGNELIGVLTEYDIIELISACREREQLYVQISGLTDEEKVYTDAMYDDISVEITKICKICKPDSLSIHVSRYNEEGDRKKYSLIGKLFANGITYNSKVIGWDLIQANKDLMKKLTEDVNQRKEIIKDARRRKN